MRVEDLENYNFDNVGKDLQDVYANGYNDGYAYAREEMAREIFSTVITYPVFSFTAKTPDYMEGYMQAIDDYHKQTKKIAKEEFGVEIGV